MLKYFETQEILKQALKLTRGSPEFLYIHYSIEAKLKKYFPEAEFHIACYVNTRGEKLWIVNFREYIMLAYNHNFNFSDSDFNEVFSTIKSHLPKIFQRGQYMVFAPSQKFGDMFEKWCAAHDQERRNLKIPCTMFHMTETQIFMLLLQKVELPKEYKFVEANIEKEAKKLTKMAGRTDVKHNEVLLKRMPYAMVTHDHSDDPIAFMLMDPCGLFRIQCTHPDHRGKGVGFAVEKKLAKRALKEQYIPFKFVEMSNTQVIEASARSQFWTRWTHNGEPVEICVYKNMIEK